VNLAARLRPARPEVLDLFRHGGIFNAGVVFSIGICPDRRQYLTDLDLCGPEPGGNFRIDSD
jgi:hypothetical protein